MAWRGTWLRGGRGILAWGGAAYLALLPLGSFVAIPVGGTFASGADLLLALLLALGGVTLLRSPGFRSTVKRGVVGGARALLPGDAASEACGSGARLGGGADVRRVAAALLLLGAYAAWTLSSGGWGEEALYAVAKGTVYLALALGAAVLLWCGIEWDQALDAWLLGTLVVVSLSLLLAIVAVWVPEGGPWSWTERVLYEGGSIAGLPGRRLRGPFWHPDAFGDYLVVSGALFWIRWPALRSAGSFVLPGLLRVGALVSGVALFLTGSTAFLPLGILLLLWGRRLVGLPALLLRAGGGMVAATTFAALVFPLRVGVGSLEVVTSGIRPAIWAESFRVFLESPVLGVGAAPAIAGTVDPMRAGSGVQLWDAHNAYLSIAGQFGIVGSALVVGATCLLVRALFRARRRGVVASSAPALLERVRSGVIGALAAVGVHGLVIAGEDYRHWWALVAVAGLAVGGAWEWESAGEGSQ